MLIFPSPYVVTGGAASPFSLTDLGAISNSGTGNVTSTHSVDIGAAATGSDTHTILVGMTYLDNAYHSGCTLDGDSFTLIGQTSNSSERMDFWEIDTTKGGSLDIVFTRNGTLNHWLGGNVWKMVNGQVDNFTTDSEQNFQTNDMVGDISTTNPGFVAAVMRSQQDITGVSWTGLTEIAENTVNSRVYSAASSATTAVETRAVSVTSDGGTATNDRSVLISIAMSGT